MSAVKRGQGTGHRAQGTGPAEGSRAGRGQIVTPPPECHGRDPPQNQMQRSCIRVWGFLRSGGLNPPPTRPSTKPNAKELYQGVGVSPERGVEPTRLKSGGTGKGSKR